MRTLCLALPLLLAGSAAHAQSAVELSLQPRSRMADAQTLSKQERDAVIVRNVGIALAIAGTGLTIAGSIYALSAIGDDNSIASTQKTNLAIPLLAAGQTAVVVGIPMWVVGSVRAAKAERAMLSLSAGGAKVTF